MTDPLKPKAKLIKHNTRGVDLPDDPSLPFKLCINLRPPEGMEEIFIALHGGSEELVFRFATKEDLYEVIEAVGLHATKRLRRFIITGPNDIVVEDFSKID